jgi:hypothetical protein
VEKEINAARNDSDIQCQNPQDSLLYGSFPDEVRQEADGQRAQGHSHLKPNRVRQSENLAIFSGFWRGSYYENGMKNPGGERIDESTIMRAGRVYHLPKRKR